MGTGYTRADTGNNIADGNIINAADLDGEFDALQSAFNETTGHTHDGTSSEGAPITFTGPAQEYVSTATELRPKANNTYDLGSATNQWKDLYVDGTANIDSLAADAGTVGGANITTVSNTQTLTNKTLTSPDINTPDIDGGTIDGTVIGGSTPAAISGTTGSFSGNLTVDTNTLFVDAATNNVGVRTSSPATQLEVVGTIRASGPGPRLSILDTGGATDEKEWGINGADGPLRIQAINDAGAGGGDLIEITRVGNSTRSIRGFRSAVESYDLSNFDRSLFFSGGVSTIGTATAHDLVVDTNNSERMRITSAGLVGIGTSAPAAQLHVAGTTTNSGNFTASITDTTMDVTAVSTGVIAVGDIIYGVGVSPITKVTALGTGTGGVGTYTVSVSQTLTAATLYAGSGSASTIRISDIDVSVLPGQPSGTIEFFGSDANAPGAGVGAYISAVAEGTVPDTALTFGTRDNAGGGIDANERMRITSLGRVGIGTSAPTAPLSVIGADNATQAIFSGALGGTARGLRIATGVFSGNNDIAILDAQFTTGVLAFQTASSERVRITSAGNVGIGTSNPTSTLDVNGSIIARTTLTALSDLAVSGAFNYNGASTFFIRSRLNGGSVVIGTETPAGTLYYPISIVGATDYTSFSTSTSEAMRIIANGNVGINETIPDYKLDVNGTFGFTPGASVTPVDNGDVVFELTNNTTLTVKAKGSDGVVRSGTITLA